MKKNAQVIKALSDVVAKITKSKREDVRAQILCLQATVGSTDDLFVDRRSLSWQEGGPARAKVDARLSKLPAPESLKYKLSWRDCDSGDNSGEYSLSDAAEIIGRTTASLCQSVNKSGGIFHTKDKDGDMVTVQRL